MGIGVRVFLLGHDGLFKRMPYARFVRLSDGDASEALPDHVGELAQFVMVYLETEDRRPAAIRHVDCIRLKIQPDGRIDSAERDRQFRLAAEIAGEVIYRAMSPDTRVNVIRASDIFLRRRHRRESMWEPSSTQLEEIRRLIFDR